MIFCRSGHLPMQPCLSQPVQTVPSACNGCLQATDPYLGSRAQTTLATNAVRAAYLQNLQAAQVSHGAPSSGGTHLLLAIVLGLSFLIVAVIALL